MVTHDPDKALKHADKIFWLKDGKIEKVTQRTKNVWKILKQNHKKTQKKNIKNKI